MKVRFAVAPTVDPLDGEAFTAMVATLERLGFDTLWLSDIPMGDVLDPLVGTSFAAGCSHRLKLGVNVVPVGRNPMLLAKELAQLDRLSGGRLLLNLVPGLDQPGERAALGETDRTGYLEEVIPLLRAWWAGETVEHRSDRFDFPGVAVRPLPVQEPLEIWLGGRGPKALDRVGRLADGWLGAGVTPADAGPARARIDAAAAAAGRAVDPEHHGLSIPYARAEPPAATVAALRRHYRDTDIADVLPVGGPALRSLVQRLVAEGLSKFVVRPVGLVADWDDELAWLAGAVLDLQT